MCVWERRPTSSVQINKTMIQVWIMKALPAILLQLDLDDLGHFPLWPFHDGWVIDNILHFTVYSQRAPLLCDLIASLIDK